MHDVALVTVVTSNHLHFALALAHSLARHHPDTPLFVCLADRPQEAPRQLKSPSRLFFAEELTIDDWPRFAFQYSPFELTCALKPFAIEFVRDHGFGKIIYLDADMQLYGELTPVSRFLDTSDVVLTPHLCQPLPADGFLPDEQSIERAGRHNAGFLAVRSGRSDSMLRWWKCQLRDSCIVDLGSGIFVDQRWLNDVPDRFDRVLVTEHPGCNVGYWNLPHRKLSRTAEGQFLVNGRPLLCFHFSGWDPSRPNVLSRYQNRIQVRDCEALEQMVRQYHVLLEVCGRAKYGRWEYRHGCLSSGQRIRPLWREAVRIRHPLVAEIEDPFDASATPALAKRLAAAGRRCLFSRRDRREWPSRLLRRSRFLWARLRAA